MRLFMEGKIDICPCWSDIEREYIIAEFDRLSALVERAHQISDV